MLLPLSLPHFAAEGARCGGGERALLLRSPAKKEGKKQALSPLLPFAAFVAKGGSGTAISRQKWLDKQARPTA